MFLTPSSSSSRAPLQWRPAADDVFVATSNGEYAGFVGVTPRGFEAQGALGQRLGVHVTRELAHDAVADAHSPAVDPAIPSKPAPGRQATHASHGAPPRQPRHTHTSRRESDCRPPLAAPLAHLRQR